MTRIGLAIALTVSATFVGGVVGAVVGSRLVPASDPIDGIANSIAGMTVGCGLFMAAATYLASRLDLVALKRLTTFGAVVGAVVLISLVFWDQRQQTRIPDSRPPAIPVIGWAEPLSTPAPQTTRSCPRCFNLASPPSSSEFF